MILDFRFWILDFVLVPSLGLGMHIQRLCLILSKESEPPLGTFPGLTWEREMTND